MTRFREHSVRGRRFALLNEYIIADQRGESSDEILENFSSATASMLVDVDVDVESELFSAVASGSLKQAVAKRIVGPQKLADLTEANILVVNPQTRLVTFNSRHVQTFFSGVVTCP